MRIVFTADIHWRLSNGDLWFETMEKIREENPDVFVIGGDIAVSLLQFEEAMDCLGNIDCQKFFVLGNHDVWLAPRFLYKDSNDKYSRFIELGEQKGFHCLELAPAIVQGVGLVGNMGWYDYTLRDKQVDVFFPNALEYYREKQFPGNHAVKDGMCVWRDGVYVEWGQSDEKVADRFVDRLERHISEIEDSVETICYFSHHIPFAEMSPKKDMNWNKGNAFGGSSRLGDVARGHSKVKHVFCGHSHTQFDYEIDGIRCINVGADYEEPRYVVVDV